MKKKILVLSPWYPTLENPVQGIFVQEQSALLSEDFDVRVLVGEPISISFIGFFISKLKTKYCGLSLSSQISDYKIQPPKAYQATYFHKKNWAVQHNIYLIQECFKTALTYLIEKENWKPDLIHAHVTNNGGIVGNFLSKQFGIPIILTEHTGNFLLHKYSSVLNNAIIKTLKEVDVLIAVGSRQKQLIHLHEIYRPIEVIGNMIDDNLFFIPPEQKISTKFRILTTTRPSYEKDLTTFLLAIREVIAKPENRDIQVDIILGSTNAISSDGEDYIKKAQNIGVLSYCNFYFGVSRDEIIDFYQSCDVFVSSSIVESFGISMCEALACGKPVISTNNGGSADIITPNNGFIVPLQDYKALAEAIIKIKNKQVIFDPEQVRASVVKKYGKEAFKDRIKSLYLQVIDSFKK
jgi:glycosyltransferase involved in cell wall biosynthesis